jgi:hypothetical protein
MKIKLRLNNGPFDGEIRELEIGTLDISNTFDPNQVLSFDIEGSTYSWTGESEGEIYNFEYIAFVPQIGEFILICDKCGKQKTGRINLPKERINWQVVAGDWLYKNNEVFCPECKPCQILLQS